ncbi:hypothetical protein NIES2101_11710 [Calothrix sp. HK-06]|nr:hypothetical protein NIES2101_11710 [Calothrix sp. HK-06]
MKLPRKISLILILIFSLVSSPVLAVMNKDNSMHSIRKSNIQSGIEEYVRQQQILIELAKKQTKQRKGFLQRFGFKRNRSERRSKVQQKQKRQGFLSRFRLGQNRNKQPKNQKRGFLRRFGL